MNANIVIFLIVARLVGESKKEYKGPVEVFFNGTWRTVCGDRYWDLKLANIVCRHLGFPGALVAATTPSVGRYNSDQSKKWFRSSGCKRNETSLNKCFYNRLLSYCSNSKAAYVTCITGNDNDDDDNDINNHNPARFSERKTSLIRRSENLQTTTSAPLPFLSPCVKMVHILPTCPNRLAYR